MTDHHPSTGSETDVEKVEDPQNDLDHGASSSDVSSVFSERHMEGHHNSRRQSSATQATLSRTTSRNVERVATTASTALATIRSRAPRRQFTHPLETTRTSKDVIVDFDGPDDPYKALNWSFNKKATTTVLYGFTTMAATLGSSIISPGVSQIAEEFHLNSIVATLAIALFLFGLGLGPLLWAPLSELYGRKIVVLVPTFISGIFAFGCGAAKDVQTVMICRFFQGVFGSAPVTNSGGALADMWTPRQRGTAMVGYAMAIVGGPTLGPIIGGAICMSDLRWRWTQYISGIYTMFIVAVDLLVVDESYPAALLVRKSQRLRHESGNWALHAKHEEWDVSISEMANKYLVRPFQLLATPICFLMALYASFCYGILYASLGSLPYEFETIRGWNKLVGALPFLAMLLGVVAASGLNILNTTYYIKRMEQNNGRPVPEARLPPMMFGSVVFVAGLFTFAWTGTKDIHWIGPCIGIFLQGAGFFTIFQAALNYLVDTFQRYAASAVAANTFLRSVFAGSFPLFITPMLSNLGVGWGVSIFAFIAVALLPIPYLFFIFGQRIRARGYWSQESV